MVAAEVTVDSPDFGHLEPMVDAAERELEPAGRRRDAARWCVADAGYWHQAADGERSSDRGIQVLIPPDARQPQGPAAGLGRRRLRVHAPRA